jgi:phage regulator Rha-like protein
MMKKIESRISSREVAEMMDMEHKDLLKKIDNINLDFGGEKIRYEKYWVESTFKNRGKDYTEYQISKRGCEFLAHKTTGTKGNLFTDKYMDKFNEMEQKLKNPQKSVISTEDKKKLAEARLKNAKARTASLYLKISSNEALPKEYKQVLLSYATKELSDKDILPLPVAEEKTYSATEIGQQLGISANKGGKLTNEHNLKTEQYGKLFHDKSRYSNKEVETFRYYENIIPVIKGLLEG